MAQRPFSLLLLLLLLLATLATLAAALYEDQAGNLDWTRQFIGPVAFGRFYQGDRTHLLLASEENVLASVAFKNGAHVWRQVLEPHGTMLGMEISGKGVVTISGTSEKALSQVRMWNIQSGKLLWELFLKEESSEHLIDSNLSGESLYLLTSSRLLSISLDGYVQWTARVDGDQIMSTKKRVAVVKHSEGNLLVTSFDPEKGTELSKESFGSASGFSVLDSKIGVFQKDGKLQVLDISVLPTAVKEFVLKEALPAASDAKNFASQIQRKSGAQKHFLLQGQDKVHLVSISSDEKPQVLATLPHQKGYLYQLEAHGNYNQLVQVTQSSLEVFDVKANSKTSIPLPSKLSSSGPITKIFLGAVQRKNSTPGARILLVLEDMSVQFFKEDGLLWTNQEALATIQHVSFVDLPVESIFLKSDLETDEQYLLERSVIENYLHRVAKHATLLQDIASSWIKFLEGLPETQDRTQLKGDLQGIRKVIVASTKGGRLFGLDSENGSIVWSLHFPGVTSGSSVLIRGAASHHPISLYVGEKHGETVFAYFDPITGELQEGSPLTKSFSVAHYSKLASTGHHHTHLVLIVDKSLRAHVFPEGEDYLATFDTPVHFYLWDASSLNGYQVMRGKDNDLKTLHTWSLPLLESEAILSVAEHSPQEKVASLGRVLGSRSVLYKYLNPHSIAVATHSAAREILQIYVIDLVSGTILSHQYHEEASGPVSMVLCENWLVYHHWNQKEHQSQLSVLEFYESIHPDTRTESANFSSYAGLTPDVLSQSYIFPTSVTAMGVTQTKQGISSRMVTLALSSDQIYGIPKRFLDPRRHPGTQSAEDKEEGLIPYEVLMPINYKSVLSYNQTVARVRGMVAAPANLESTSLLLSYGLDLFFVRTAPSKIFDALTDEFEYAMLLAAMAVMSTALFAAWYFARRKELKLLWH